METRKDQRFLVLLLIALLICLVHSLQKKRDNKKILETNCKLVWITGIPNPSMYLISGSGVLYNELNNFLSLSLSQEDLCDKFFIPVSRQNYIFRIGAGIVPATNSYQSAPFFYRRIPLNETNTAMLTIIPGIGPKLAKKIVDYRQKRGGFKSLDELREVNGVGEKKVNILKKYVML